MAKKMILAIVVLVAALAINVSSASATGSSEPQAVAAANGACGGGSSLKQMISGWKKHGVLDDVARSAGQTPGVDGSSSSIVKGGIVMVIVVRGGYVTNFTCRGGKFRNLRTKKYIPAGSRYYVPEKYAPAKCKKGKVKTGYEARCGNKQVGNLLVKRPCNKKPPKKTPKTPPPIVTPPPSSGGCTVIIGGDNNGVAGCGNIVTCTINGKQITDSTVCSSYNSCIAIQGYTWNSTQNVCVPPPPPPSCEETGTCPSSVAILSMTDLNDIPTGKSSGPYYVEVSASAAGGTLTVDPGIGSITDCNGGTRQGSITLPVPKGVTKFCFVIWAPDDPAKPSQMTVTATAVLGNSFVRKEDVLLITYPTRPE